MQAFVSFLGGKSVPQTSGKGDIEIVYQVNTGWLCPARLVLENAFSLPKNKNRSQTFSYLFPSFRFAFHEVIYWYHHGKFPTARENLFYILLESRSNFEEERKSLPGKIVFPSISLGFFLLVFVEFSSTRQNWSFPLRARCHDQFGCIKNHSKSEKEIWKFNCGCFQPKSVAVDEGGKAKKQ